MTCLLDTGSSDLWIPSKLCKACKHIEHRFNANKSSTFLPALHMTPEGYAPRAMQISYGSGTILGYEAQDTVTFAGRTIHNQSFLIVEDELLPENREWDGICGFGWDTIAQMGRPLYSNLQRMGSKAMYTFVPEDSTSARLYVGPFPQHAVQPGTVVWTDAEKAFPEGKKTFWFITGGIAVHKKKPHSARFLVDTGTNQVLLAPRKLYTSIMQSVLPERLYDDLCYELEPVYCDCSILERSRDLPPLRIFISGRPFELPVREMFIPVHREYGQGTNCILAIQPNNINVGDTMPGQSRLPLPGGLGGILGGLERKWETVAYS
ncbi:cardB, partial [Symbiodinium pilosum]